MGYFGAIVPNTALAKEAFVSNWNQGGLFFSNFFQLYALLVPIGFVFVLKSELYLWLWRKKGLLHVLVYSAPTWVGLLYVLYIIKMGGGFMHGRMWMGPVFCLLLPVFVLPITRSSRLSRPWMWAGWAVVVMWSFIVVAFVRVAKENEYGIGDERGWYTRQATQRNPVFAYHYRTHSFYKNTQKDLAKWRKACEKGKTCPILLMTKHHSGKHLQLHPGFLPVRKGVVATQSKLLLIRGAVGIASVMAGQHIHIVDYLGLGSPLASRVRLGTKRGRPGHEKNLSHTWLIARFAKAHSHDPQALKYARKALTCKGSPLGAMLHGIRARLTWSRFWSNVRHSWEWSRLRIHAHPRKEDVHRLCKS
jgi:arabinofuranosyltransferase